MKKHLSILILAVRGTIYKLGCMLIVMSAAQIALFYVTMQNNKTLGLEQAIAHSGITLVFGVCFLLLCALVTLNGCGLRGAKLRYTVWRLSVSEKAITLWWSAYNAACFLIFWAAELAIMLVLCRIYMSYGDPQHVSGQTVFLAAYRSQLFHSLMPLEESSRYVCNILLAFGLGVSSACFSHNMRHDKRGAAIIFMAAVTAVFFARGMGSLTSDVVLSILSIIVIAVSISGLRGVKDDEA